MRALQTTFRLQLLYGPIISFIFIYYHSPASFLFWVGLLSEGLNQKIVYLFVTSFDIPKPIITKPMIIIVLKYGKVCVTILKLFYELGK